MLGWVLDWLVWLAWYGAVLGGWLCWWAAHQRANRTERELNLMASSLRYATPHRETVRDG